MVTLIKNCGFAFNMTSWLITLQHDSLSSSLSNMVDDIAEPFLLEILSTFPIINFFVNGFENFLKMIWEKSEKGQIPHHICVSNINVSEGPDVYPVNDVVRDDETVLFL